MACGLPLLCKYDPCLDEVIQEGENGLTYKQKDDFYAKLNKLLTDENYRKTLGTNAKTTAFDKFSAQSFAKKVLEVYKRNLKATEKQE